MDSTIDIDARLERVSRERDLYLRILELGAQDDVEPFLSEALSLIVELTGAARGYVALYSASEGPSSQPLWSLARGCTDQEVAGIRESLSRGIIARALESGRTILTPSAMLDPRFRDRESVREASIEAVLCAPVGWDAPVGVVYLQSRAEGEPFQEQDREQLERFARHIAPLCDRLIVRHFLERSEDPTAPWRARLNAEGLVGRSAALAATLKDAAAAAPLRDVTVLLTGESGTGKTQLARLIHENSPRAGGPFIELNAAALPEQLVESELFGAARGGHSAAMQSVPGKVAAAQGGTLFLDEIGELPSAAQAKLLQLLHSKEYYPLGAVRSVRADIRIIAATNMDLHDAVAAGRFREDLYFRLDVLRIHIPSLAQRRDDIPELARFLCAESCRRNRLAPVQLSSTAALAAQNAEWPGNIRQLANVVERAVARASAEGVPVAETRHLFPESGADVSSGQQPARTWQEATRRFQRELLEQTLRETGGNVSETARRLELVRGHVYTLMKSFGLSKDG
jgi:Nif-specific regulatory protein